jgi:hypothetical protein
VGNPSCVAVRDTSACIYFIAFVFVVGCCYRARSRSYFLATTPSRCTGSASLRIIFDLEINHLGARVTPKFCVLLT